MVNEFLITPRSTQTQNPPIRFRISGFGNPKPEILRVSYRFSDFFSISGVPAEADIRFRYFPDTTLRLGTATHTSWLSLLHLAPEDLY